MPASERVKNRPSMPLCANRVFPWVQLKSARISLSLRVLISASPGVIS